MGEDLAVGAQRGEREPAARRRLTAEGERALAASPRLPHLLVIHARPPWGREEENVTPIVLEQGKGREL